MENLGFACPCCRYKTLGERGQYDICAVCFWEDDGDCGPNHISLREAQANFEKFGACDLDALAHVLKDGPSRYKREVEDEWT